MIYCVDTSSLIAAWQERYPIENFPKFWDRIDGLVKDGRMISPIEVFNEIKKRSDDLHSWLRSRKDGMFRELDDDVQIEVANVLQQFPRLVGDKKLRTSADPFVIALVRTAGYQLVTEEKPTGNPNRPNIPDVCAQLSLSTIGILQVIQREKWVAG
ncbi:MAG TPA: DUF4411 family protein [Terracidiphilus sp.]|nr:DUF4411 family protein [Terracidiphilus sp.]